MRIGPDIAVIGRLLAWLTGAPRRNGDAVRRSAVPNKGRLVGNLLLAAGAACLLLAAVAYYGETSEASRVLPRPVALAGSSSSPREAPRPSLEEPSPTETAAPTAEPTATATPASEVPAAKASVPAAPLESATPTREPTETPVPTATPTPAPPGLPVRMVIPKIDLDSRVREAGTYWENGELHWQTLPFVVAHYASTSEVGADGNAVFSGHVTSQSAGNVFRELYKMEIGDEIQIFTEESEFIYVVAGVEEVLPIETWVMDPTPDPTATLITCSGEWIPSRREYTHRLVVTAKLKR